MEVFKFGGSFVKNAEGIRNMVNSLQTHKEESLIIVLSALGETTEALEKVVDSFVENDGKAFEQLNEIKKEHYDIIRALFAESHEIYTDVNDAFVEVEWALEDQPHEDYGYDYDQIVSVGEVVCSIIVAAFLKQYGFALQWLDARDIILTDNTHRRGSVQWLETVDNINRIAKPMLKKGGFLITQGFIGTTSENFTTTLGKEGGNYTAAIFAYGLDAESLSILESENDADKKILDRESYMEAIENKFHGSKISSCS